MKTIIFYGRTQVGSVVLSYLVAKGYRVKVIPEDDIVRSLCRFYELEIVTLDTMGEFDLFVCCHGEKIIPEGYLQDKKFINMHSCLWKYKGKDPINRYIVNKDTEASIESHYMVKEVDAGEVIARVPFTTPVVKTHGEYFNIALPHYYKCIDQAIRVIFGSVRSVAMVRINQKVKPLLEMWLKYYSQFFDELRVFSCGAPEEELKELQKQYPFIIVPVSDDIYSNGAHEAVFKAQKELLKDFDWTMYTDADEIVVPNLEIYKDLKDFMKKTSDQTPLCFGYQVYKLKTEKPIDYGNAVLNQRTHWVHDSSGSYNKPALSRVPCSWVLGFHKLTNMDDVEVRKAQDNGLYMIHLKYIDKELEDIGSENKPEKIPDKYRSLL